MDSWIEIFKLLDNLDNLRLVNKEFNKILSSEKFWIRRFFFRYGRYCKDAYIFRSGTWKEYCQDIERREISYYTTAKAVEEKRFDIVSIMSEKYNIRVKEITSKTEVYYLRENLNIKEGKYTILEGNKKVEYIYKVGKIYQKTIFENDKIKSETFYKYSTTDEKFIIKEIIHSDHSKKTRDEKYHNNKSLYYSLTSREKKMFEDEIIEYIFI